MFCRHLTLGAHTRSFVVTSLEAEGWEVTIEENERLLRRTRYTDWHRAERAMASFEREVAALVAEGWRITSQATASPAQSTNR